MTDKIKTGECRDWAWEHMRGCANVLIPSYSADCKELNEQGIRLDVRRDIELGFTGSLLVGETAVSGDEYVRFAEWAQDEADGRLELIYHACFNTLEENIELGRRCVDAGVKLALLGFPPSFYPSSQEEIFQYVKAFCDSVDAGVILFPVPLWGFERLHGASIDPGYVVALVDEIENIVAVKAEGGAPSIACFTQLHHLIGDRVIVSLPVEDYGIPLATLVPMQWMGTGNMEYYGSAIPRMHALIQAGKPDEAMDVFWSISPAREVNRRVRGVPGANTPHRMMWKYMAWLNGFNGGPVRVPTMRLVHDQMNALRNGLKRSGIPVTDDTDDAFFAGRATG